MQTDTITFVGIFVIFMYGATRMLGFYGMDISSYGVYLLFYAFLFLSFWVLKN